MSILVSLLLGQAFAANPLGPGVTVKEVAAPPVLVSGVRTLTVQTIKGTGGKAVTSELVAGFEDHGREVGKGTAADRAGDLVQMGAMVGGQMLSAQIGGLGSKLTQTATATAGGAVAGLIAGDKFVLDDGLTVELFALQDKGADGVLSGVIENTDEDKRFEKEIELKDKDGNVVKDSEGKVVMTKVSCVRRTVTAKLTWTIQKGDAAAAGSERTGSAYDEKCGADIGDLNSVLGLAEAAASGMGMGIVADIKPAWRSYRVGLRKDKSLAAGLRAATKDEIPTAACLFNHMTGLDPANGTAVYNRGAIEEVLGQYDLAVASYASSLELGGPKRMATKGTERTAERKAEVESMVEAYGLEWTVQPLDYAACPALPEGTPKMVKKGTTFQVGDEEIEVDKGETVFVQSEDGGTAKVLLMDGTAVELPAKTLK